MSGDSVVDKARRRLLRAAEDGHVRQISSRFADAGRLDGVVVAVGQEWAVIAQTMDGGYFDGWVALLVDDVVRVVKDKSFQGRFAKTQPEWPPVLPAGLDPDSVTALLGSLSKVTTILAIERESRVAGSMWIGVPTSSTPKWLYLHEIRPDATWHSEELGYKFKTITRIEWGTHYLTALEAMAGPFPGDMPKSSW